MKLQESRLKVGHATRDLAPNGHTSVFHELSFNESSSSHAQTPHERKVSRHIPDYYSPSDSLLEKDASDVN